jgi:CheY-like chemotaxis protein
MDGLETIRSVHGRSPGLPILAISGSRTLAGFVAPNYLDAAIAFGAVSVLCKPFGSRELLCAVAWSTERDSLHRARVQYD